MNLKLLLIALSAASLASCSTAYKSGQTPDDVYYSPVRSIEENTETKNNREDDRISPEDRQIRMASRDRRWRDLDYDYDYNCRYDPYRYGYTYGYYYNPYYYPYPVYSGYSFVNPKNSTPRMVNLGGYNPQTLVVSNPKTGEVKWTKAPKVYNNSNNSSNNGGFVRRILTNTSNSSTNSSNNNRTYSPSSNSSNSGSSSSGRSSSSGTPVSRPSRAN